MLHLSHLLPPNPNLNTTLFPYKDERVKELGNITPPHLPPPSSHLLLRYNSYFLTTRTRELSNDTPAQLLSPISYFATLTRLGRSTLSLYK